MPSCYNIAHRGASGHAPENTLAAFRLAEGMGADMVELDLRQTKDGHLVVFHDASLGRVLGLRRQVRSMTLLELQRLDAGSWFGPAFHQERIPTLDEVFACVGRMELNVEIKHADPAKVLTCLAKWGVQQRIVLSSFDPLLLRQLRVLDRSARLGYLLGREVWDRASQWVRDLQLQSLHLSVKRVNEPMIRTAQGAGLKVFVYTVDRESEMERMLKWKVDGIFTNFPDRLSGLLRRSAAMPPLP